MFKRFLVLDLYEKPAKEDGEWIDITKEIPKTDAGIFFVKYTDSNICQAYFCADKIAHLAKPAGIDSVYWWNRQTKKPMYDVTHWMK